MPKIEVDRNICIGCGLCASTCPDCFQIQEDGKSHVIGTACECDLQEVALDCPVQAISVDLSIEEER